MVLVVLSFKKIKLIWLLFISLSATTVFARPTQSFDVYSRASNVVIKAISKAQKHVWITTDFLSDGALVNALYLANLRRLDVKLLIKRSAVGQPLDQTDYLVKRKVPVFFKANEGASQEVSAVLVDGELILFNSSFHFRTKNTRFKIKYINKKLHKRFRQAFLKSSSTRRGKNLKSSKRIKTQKRSRGLRSGKQNIGTVLNKNNTEHTEGGVFSYDDQKPQRDAPTDIQKSLPKLPVYMQKLLDNEQSSVKGEKK